MTRGKAFTEVGGQVRELPIERRITGFFDITVLFLGAWAHAFFEDVNNSVKRQPGSPWRWCATLLRTDGGVKKGRTLSRESRGERSKRASGGSGVRAPFKGASEYGQPRVSGRR